ncbi:hypothetical protein SISSUDRAFT_1029121 [Sistotremastrum suecicum HHB10207 ss-3]|uniref:Uncharacterized protein n=1 Tax=Sistotremastrum suecicum HHB10207 ss-3 TaxID=1314776 RepID=A0A166J6T5_9AGAM|nr:hypothetical protein SISSUDRAFT_1029121 [Sistotremastrum suecicum HHB10207 ss-3]
MNDDDDIERSLRNDEPSSSDDDEPPNDIDRTDHTARISRELNGSQQGDGPPTALSRVRSLGAQRRQIAHVLSSISSASSSRLATPSPPHAVKSQATPSPAPQASSFSSISSSNSASRFSYSSSRDGASISGSETEREPTSIYSSSRSAQSFDYLPQESLQRGQNGDPGPSGSSSSTRVPQSSPETLETPRTRTPSFRPEGIEDHRTVSRNGDAQTSSSASADQTSSSDRRNGIRRYTPSRNEEPLSPPFNDEPSTSDRLPRRSSPSPSPATTTGAAMSNPRRSATVREPRRWQGRNPYSPSEDHDVQPTHSRTTGVERRQSLRGGSAESALARGSRSVIGQSLRAAGLASQDRDGRFTTTDGLPRTRRLSGDSDLRHTLSRVNRNEPEFTNRHDFRPSTSTSTYNNERTSPQLRPYRSTMALVNQHGYTPSPPERRRDTVKSAGGMHEYMSTAPPGRHSSADLLSTQSSLSTQSPEHAKLMLDSLTMFESHLARFPASSNSVNATISDLHRNAQSIVQSTSSLNAFLREGHSFALEQQIEAEYGDKPVAVDPMEVWGRVGGEYKESLRVCDELVRTMTGFLLGMGKILKEATAASAREVRIDEEGRVVSPSGTSSSTSRRSMEGRRSTDLRRSWGPEPMTRRDEGDVSQSRTPSRLDSLDNRSPSVLGKLRSRRDTKERDTQRASTLSTLQSRLTFTSRIRPQLDAEQSPTTPSPSNLPPKSNPLSHSSTVFDSPPPLPALPSENPLNRRDSGRGTRRNKSSSTSITTVKAFPAIASPQATTAVSTATVSNAAFGERSTNHARNDSSVDAGVVFSRPAAVSVSALNGLQRTNSRDRHFWDRGNTQTNQTSSNLDHERMAAVLSSSSSSETKPNDTFTPRMSLETVRPGNNGTTQTRRPQERRDRRRTITEIFSRDNRD